MMATLTLSEANSKLISKDPTSDRVVTSGKFNISYLYDLIRIISMGLKPFL